MAIDKYERHAEICQELNKTYKVKNVAYGDSFSKNFKKRGIQSAIVRMGDKWNRIEALADGAENAVKDESLKDTLDDMANYCIMLRIELEQAETDKGAE